MGNTNNKNKDFAKLAKTSRFSAEELKDFYAGFKRDFPNEMIDRQQFQALYQRLFQFNSDSTDYCNLLFEQYDSDRSGLIDFKEFILTLSVASRGTAEEKLRWAFSFYDLDKSGFLTEEEIARVLYAAYKAKGIPESRERATTVARNIVRQSDDNGDGKVSQEEFVNHAKSSEDVKELLKSL